ncbi:hypothetical protein [Streptomyces sp. MST-110588]|nr:hypothetical protein [Streptomyces sp. MST-110588]UNO40750.1 hypothetical protein KGS77_15690 [Streptomyces sp. MST-110588]
MTGDSLWRPVAAHAARRASRITGAPSAPPSLDGFTEKSPQGSTIHLWDF